jgi:steroid 5-alpha reductase family enzyme
LAHPQGGMFVFSPIVMTFFLLKVSGVAMLEVKLKKSKPQYAEYIRTTSSFIPMPPKK